MQLPYAAIQKKRPITLMVLGCGVSLLGTGAVLSDETPPRPGPVPLDPAPPSPEAPGAELPPLPAPAAEPPPPETTRAEPPPRSTPARPEAPPYNWRHGYPPPPGYHIEYETRRYLALPGAALFVVAWGSVALTGIIAGAQARDDGRDDSVFRALPIPFAGPIIALDRYNPEEDSTEAALVYAFLVLDFVAQVTAPLLVAAGFYWKRPTLVWQAPVSRLDIRPAVIARSTYGLAVTAHFF